MSNDSKLNGSKKCIICLQCATTMVPLDTNVDIDGVPISCETVYFKFTGLQYDPATVPPEHRSFKLCLACLNQLSSCYVFQKQAVENFYELVMLSHEKLLIELDTISYAYTVTEPSNKLAEICPEFEEDDGASEVFMEDCEVNEAENHPSPSPEEVSYAPDPETDTEEEGPYEEDAARQSVNVETQNEPSALLEDETVTPASLSSCKECNALADQTITFRKHFMRAHCVLKGHNQHHCNLCARCFKSKGSFLQHIRVHTGTKQYACRYCPKSFHYLHHLQIHERTHTNERPFRCGKCAKAFASNDRLQMHQRTTHQEAHPYECTLCQKRFKHRLYLQRHKQVKHDRREAGTLQSGYRCERCEIMFPSETALTLHRKLSCGGVDPSSHQVGGETTLKSTVSSETKHQCDVCGMHFKQKIALTRHKLRHDGVRPFRCEICDSAFTQKGTLKTHMRTHTDEKPYECSDCGACFRSAAALRSHRLRQRCPAGQQV